MDQNRFQLLASALDRKGASLPCPRCGNSQFQIVGESVISIQEDPAVFQVGGPGIPSVVVGCAKCGCLFHHATNLLLDSETKEQGK